MAGPRSKDLTGKKFGLLTVLYREPNSGGASKHARWVCQCECGNTTSVESGHLTSSWRPILSCGCLKHTNCNTNLRDLTDQRFGLLTAKNIVEHRGKGKHVKWLCVCDCGNETIVDSSDLTKGNIISCGCKTMSSGEIAVKNILDLYGVEYKFQYPLYDLITSKSGNPVMDFAIKNNEKIIAFIEFQGEQHYIDVGWFGHREREETDELKKEYCKTKNIPLYEIRFDEEVAPAVANILSTLMLIPCQASEEEGVTTIR